MDDYFKKLSATKTDSPFARWQESGLDQYTPEVAAAFTQVFDDLVAKLAALGETAREEEKLECLHGAVEAINALNREDETIIETGEREDLCDLFNKIATAAGLNPEDYGDGEGPASIWRDW